MELGFDEMTEAAITLVEWPERGQGFSRPRQNGHQGRGSDELSSQSNVEILVGQ